MKQINLYTVYLFIFTVIFSGCSKDDDLSFQEQINHEFVDFNLPSGTLWATCNIGASSPEEYGLYFAWGETIGYSSNALNGKIFDWYNYKWMTPGEADCKHCTKYTYEDKNYDACWYNKSNYEYVGTTVDGITYKNLTELEINDDAASQNWGSQWRIPSEEQIQELVENTTSEWTSINGVYGRSFTSKTDPTKYIFLPAAGNQHPYGMGEIGYYWTRDLSSYKPRSLKYGGMSPGRSYYAQKLWFSSSVVLYSGNADDGDCSSDRYEGFSIRPVCMK